MTLHSSEHLSLPQVALTFLLSQRYSEPTCAGYPSGCLRKSLWEEMRPARHPSFSWWKLFHLCVFSVGQRQVSAGRLGGWQVLGGRWMQGCPASAAWGHRRPCCPPWWGRWWLCPLCQHDQFDQCDVCSLQMRKVNIKTMAAKISMWNYTKCKMNKKKLKRGAYAVGSNLKDHPHNPSTKQVFQ